MKFSVLMYPHVLLVACAFFATLYCGVSSKHFINMSNPSTDNVPAPPSSIQGFDTEEVEGGATSTQRSTRPRTMTEKGLQ